LLFFSSFAKFNENLLLGSSIGRAGGCKKRNEWVTTEIHSGMQLPREIVVEKSGEFREAFTLLKKKQEYGNPEPSYDLVKKIREGAETRAYARTPGMFWGKRPTP
jgi:hypothetical protein